MTSRFAVPVCFAFIVLLTVAPRTIGRMVDVPGAEFQNTAEQRILSNFVSTNREYPAKMRASLRIADTGKIDSVKLTFISKNPETALSLLEAIYCSSPLPPLKELAADGHQLRSVDVFLDLNKLPKIALSTEKRDRHSVQMSHLHLIPLDVLNRYPGLFSRSELLAPPNIVSLPNEKLIAYSDNFHPAPAKKLMNFFKAWESFFIQHPEATRAELLAFKKHAKAVLLGD